MPDVMLGLRAWLLASERVAALTTRIAPAPLPQSWSLPAVTYQVISGVPAVQHDGPSGLVRYRVQLDCWAADYSGAADLAAAVRAALSAQRWGDLSMIETERDMPEPETGYHRRLIDVLIWHEE